MKKNKKILLLICVLTCIFALTSCGNDKKEAPFNYDVSSLVNNITNNIESVAEWNDEIIKSAIEEYDEDDENEAALRKGLVDFSEMKDEIGDYIGFYLDDNNNVKYSVEEKDDAVEVTVKAKFSKRDVKITYVYAVSHKEIVIKEMIYEPQYSVGETMKEAALNTVIGIVTVVCVLFFLSILIAQFIHVQKIQKLIDKIKGKSDKKTEPSSENSAISETVESESVEDVTDDTEIVAVITAAIAASQSNVSADGFVVRSIKRVSSRKW